MWPGIRYVNSSNDFPKDPETGSYEYQVYKELKGREWNYYRQNDSSNPIGIQRNWKQTPSRVRPIVAIEDVSTESLTRNTDHDDQINHEEDDQDAFESQFPQVSLLFRNIYVQSPFLS